MSVEKNSDGVMVRFSHVVQGWESVDFDLRAFYPGFKTLLVPMLDGGQMEVRFRRVVEQEDVGVPKSPVFRAAAMDEVLDAIEVMDSAVHGAGDLTKKGGVV